MSRALSPAELKVLVRQLVKACGGVEAAALELGVSHQRISQLQDINRPDQMSLPQVASLEALCGKPVVSDAMARAITEAAAEPIAAAVVDSVGTGAALLAEVHSMDADGRRDAGEIRDVQLRAAEHLRQAQEAFDASISLKPGGTGA